MSRIGKQPVSIPDGVEIKIEGKVIVVKGPKGELTFTLPRGVEVSVENNEIIVKRKSEQKLHKSLHGTYRALIANAVEGVTKGWTKSLEMVGTGYRSEIKGTDLVVNVGYSHPIIFKAEEDISFKVEKSTITIGGIDKEKVGLYAARIRKTRPPEPYKGKGIKYTGEIVRRKPGKAAKSS